MRKAFILTTIMCLASLANAKPEQRILVLGEGQIKNLSVNFGEGYCADAGNSDYSKTEQSDDVIPIDGGFQCKESNRCWYTSGFWFDLKLNGKTYKNRGYTTIRDTFEGKVTYNQCIKNSHRRFDEVAEDLLKNLDKAESGLIIVDGVYFKNKEKTEVIVTCYKREVEIIFDIDTNIINKINYRNKTVKCP